MNAPMPVRQTSTTALISLISGILAWFMLPFIGAIVAIICGHLARGEIRRAPPGTIEGDGMALAGLILGWVQIVLTVLVVIALLLLFGGLAFLYGQPR
ncbi:MAG: DUF4190 domain-containing protein [Dokdonella sp.]|uniref:DUF4190 domain-containing protein n=1 Tax=Dokdonella sp. TaxID=2291710 RepID=UPI0025BF2DD6|nr:DUF4190 domain-containing protein [Dokdonella sp.]MBZ0222091.1 DUF4190 domain-containing protein [Dokdonella sp.]MCC7254392.1 DUF4190 domain-containing protein [Dokdonella sp.]